MLPPTSVMVPATNRIVAIIVKVKIEERENAECHIF